MRFLLGAVQLELVALRTEAFIGISLDSLGGGGGGGGGAGEI